MVRAYWPSTAADYRVRHAAARIAEKTRRRASPELTKPYGGYAAGPELCGGSLAEDLAWVGTALSTLPEGSVFAPC